ncbi:sigma-70 family RNA polymerase sigma factor [Virgibacillus kekensis]|uniref:Sigma-70 family RNA polymerase sigma factor n=1 Tax=Virgibacillus kekensis TaxID=202261 RepID=A0ABV9DGZ7_9BACI
MNTAIGKSFETILEENENRIYFQIHKLHINDPHQEFYQEGLEALWNAYLSYLPDKGSMTTYFNYSIRNRLIDLLRRKTVDQKYTKAFQSEFETQCGAGNRNRRNGIGLPVVGRTDMMLIHSPLFELVREGLTTNQQKWVNYYILEDKSVKEIAELEGVSESAVKSWGRQARKKLKDVKVYVQE